jgi:Spy/CpxP family protein refolding chaperone
VIDKGEKNMRRFVYSAIVAATLGLGAFAIADAQGVAAGQEPGRRGPGGRMGLPFARVVDDLTDAQRQQIRAIVEQERQSRQGAPAEMSLRRQLQIELLADVPDEQKVATLQEQIAQATTESLARHVAVQRQVAQVLTPEQRAKAREALANAPERGPRARFRGR